MFRGVTYMNQLPVLIKKFPNGRQAMAVRTNGKTDLVTLVTALDLPHYSALLIISGGAGKMAAHDRLARLFATVGRMVRRCPGMIVLDGGTQAGVMQLMGEGLAGAGTASTHIGVLPAKAAMGADGLKAEDALEPHHSNFVLVDSEE